MERRAGRAGHGWRRARGDGAGRAGVGGALLAAGEHRRARDTLRGAARSAACAGHAPHARGGVNASAAAAAAARRWHPGRVVLGATLLAATAAFAVTPLASHPRWLAAALAIGAAAVV